MICGVSPGVAGFSVPDEAGRWGGFDVDICRAVAAAVFGDAGKVRYTPLSPKDRGSAAGAYRGRGILRQPAILMCAAEGWTRDHTAA